MRLGTAIEKLVENYNYAVGKEWVQDKVAWALYHTWKEADEHRAKQTEPQTRTDEDGRVWDYRNGNWWQLGKTENSSEKPNNSTISKMEQVDEPQTMLNDGTLVINVEDATKVSRVLVGDDKNRGDLYYPDDEDEPQTDCAWR